jgi:acyl-CoA reductase-like NAD-dependent aldehyde dehydrogenase
VVAALIADPRVRMVNFTGSTSAGRIIGVQAAQHLKPALLELGGKNPLIILEDADPDLAVDAAVFGAFMNSGQLCMSTDRIIIHNSLAGRFIPRYLERVKALPPATPPIPRRSSGPLSTRVVRSVSRSSSKTQPPRGPACSPATQRPRGRTERSSGRSCSPT